MVGNLYIYREETLILLNFEEIAKSQDRKTDMERE